MKRKNTPSYMKENKEDRKERLKYSKCMVTKIVPNKKRKTRQQLKRESMYGICEVSEMNLLQLLVRGLDRYLFEGYEGNALIEYFKNEQGMSYVQEFLNGLEPEVREAVINNIVKLRKLGANARYPLIDNLGNKIYELRTQVKNGRNTWVRILYFWVPGNKIIMTNGFIKKCNKTPPGEIEIAERRRKEYLHKEKYNG